MSDVSQLRQKYELDYRPHVYNPSYQWVIWIRQQITNGTEPQGPIQLVEVHGHVCDSRFLIYVVEKGKFAAM